MRVKMLCLVLLLCSTVSATTQHEVFNNAIPFNSDVLNGLNGLDQDTATLANPQAARDLINKIRSIQSGAANLLKADGSDPSSYVLIHLLRWTDSSTPDKMKVQADHWYLYRDVAIGKWSQEDFTSNKRLLGVKQVYILYVHLNDGTGKLVNSTSAAYIPNYDFTITKKTPANVAHLYALLQAYSGGTKAESGPSTSKFSLLIKEISAYAVWGGGVINIQYRPSDILIKSTFRVKPGDPGQNLTANVTFDNEGPYYWDVGFAVPVRKISELKLDSTSGTATPAQVNSQNVFAVLDGYFPPVDVSSSGFTAIPHPLAGVAFAKQPLNKILVGGAWGPRTSELYLGAMFVKQPELSANSSCSSPSGTLFTGKSHYCAQFTIGINLSVSAIASRLGAPK
jgi:hypothetical protein